ncbi:glycosyl hydrolase family 43 [Micromonospora pisi]|uniref:Glycosyl hydrolase family 43 n=1 Tax=Micromonospora pisi TaxID=589240 RepID=A0A495JMZ6_9ACTN|nr:glycoside hydrolase family 43 protein [Micromonospora pisi]RKR90283.1 glycosyl hydrolase family 43 [Micromonospora pisi]
MIAVLALVLLALSVGGWAGNRGGSTAAPRDTPTMFSNPVHQGDTPDPQAIRVGETWYLVHTNNGGQNVPMLTSSDLVSWSPAGDALPNLPSWADTGRTWAPEIIALAPTRYLLYYTAADRTSGLECIGRAVATEPQGPYRDDSPAPLICPTHEGGAIDPSPYRDSDGTLWLLWKNDGNAIGADTWLTSQRLSDDGLRLVGEPHHLLKQTKAWEGPLVEGPFFWRHDGRLFLFFAANTYDRSSYAEGYAVCDDPTGPCVDAPENPILRSNAVATGPGHASMIEYAGQTWLLYHAWQPGREGKADPGRQLWLDRVTWDGGRPQVHGPTAALQPRPVPAAPAP